MGPSLPTLQQVSTKFHKAECPGESHRKNGGRYELNGGFSISSITFTVGEIVGCRNAPVTLSPCNARLTLALPRRWLTYAVLGTTRRTLTSYNIKQCQKYWYCPSCTYQAITFKNSITVEILNTS